MHFVSNPLLSLNGDEYSKKLGRREESIFLKNYQDKRGWQRKNTKFVGVMGFFHFNLLNIICYVN